MNDTKVDDAKMNPSTVTPHPTRTDKDYYKPDGDCFLLVGKVMFKVHRCLLTRDSSIFETMFSLPAASHTPQQGSSLSDPIVLHEDPKHFRALCWALYALPHEITSQLDCKSVRSAQLISLAWMCNKYQLPSIERWCCNVIASHITHKFDCEFISDCSLLEDRVASLTEVSVLCHWEQFTTYAVAQWAETIEFGDVDRYARALTTAERLGLHRFQGVLYYQQLLEMAQYAPPNGIYCVEPLPLFLTPKQQQKLYIGSWSLTSFWTIIMGRMDQPPSCGSIQCQAQWMSCWPGYHGLALCDPDPRCIKVDYINNFSRLVDVLDKKGFRSMCCYCYDGKVEILKAAKEELEANLADHFLGPDERRG